MQEAVSETPTSHPGTSAAPGTSVKKQTAAVEKPSARFRRKLINTLEMDYIQVSCKTRLD